MKKYYKIILIVTFLKEKPLQNILIEVTFLHGENSQCFVKWRVNFIKN